MREIDGIQIKGSHNAFFISADNIYPEAELIDQDQNKRKNRYIFPPLRFQDPVFDYCRCIVPGDEDQSDQIILFYFLPKCS